MSDKYQHTPLSPSMIRVIKVEPKKFKNEVSCIIRHVDSTKFEYEALSYVWGDEKATRDIYVSDKAGGQKHRFPIHESLWRFLNWAWDQKINRWIWTDRICLNQEDRDEIAHQIPRMGDVYRNANQVLAWLDMSENAGKHLELLKNVRDTEDVAYLSEIRVELPHETKLFANIFRRHKYWRRVWVIQEVVMAEFVVVVVGNFEMAFEEARACTFSFTQSTPDDVYDSTAIDTLSWMRQHDGRLGLFEVLGYATNSRFQCGRPQDRIYGLLGLVAGFTESGATNHIEIDYDKSASEVMLDAVLIVLESQETVLMIPSLARLLLGRGGVVTMPIFDLLTKYLASNDMETMLSETTRELTERQKKLVKYTFQTADALNTLFDLSGTQPGGSGLSRALHGMYRQFSLKSSFKPTVEAHAAMLGVIIVLEDASAMFENWKTCEKQHHRSVRSLWRCAAHVPRGRQYPGRRLLFYDTVSKHVGHGENKIRRAAELFTNNSFDPQLAVKACRRYTDEGRSCNGSTMVLEFPEIGFWMTLDLLAPGPQVEGIRSGRLCIQFLDPELAPGQIEGEDGPGCVSGSA